MVVGLLGIALTAPLTSPLLAQSPTVSITNLTRGGTSFLVGDYWSISITGPPNQQVVNCAIHNGQDLGCTAYGYTSAGGNFNLTGSMPGWAVGNWIQTWYVGGVAAVPTLTFIVAEGCEGATIPIAVAFLYTTDYYDQSSQAYLYSDLGFTPVIGQILNPPHCFIAYADFAPLDFPVMMSAQNIFASAYHWEMLVSDTGPPPFGPRCFNCLYPVIHNGSATFVAFDALWNPYFYQCVTTLWVSRTIF